MFSGFAGLTASGVSFWAVVSRLTLTTVAEPAARALKLGVPSVVMGASRQAVRSTPAPRAAHNELESRMQDLRVMRFIVRGQRAFENRPDVLKTRNSQPLLRLLRLGVYLASSRLVSIFPLPFGPGSSVGRAAD